MFDAERQIRFVYPPVFLAGSILFGLWLDDQRSFEDILPGGAAPNSPEQLVIAVATGTVLLIASGFAISSLTVLAMTAASEVRGWKPHQASLDEPALDAIHARLSLEGKRQPVERRRSFRNIWEKREDETLYLSATLDHELLADGIHDWVQRRWGMFYLAAHSAVALVLALPLGASLEIFPYRRWMALSALTALGFLVISRWAWLDTMGMLALTYTTKDLTKRKWRVAFTLG